MHAFWRLFILVCLFLHSLVGVSIERLHDSLLSVLLCLKRDYRKIDSLPSEGWRWFWLHRIDTLH